MERGIWISTSEVGYLGWGKKDHFPPFLGRNQAMYLALGKLHIAMTVMTIRLHGRSWATKIEVSPRLIMLYIPMGIYLAFDAHINSMII